ncbi:MAG: PAS domain S-box protein, partial [bacterium]
MNENNKSLNIKIGQSDKNILKKYIEVAGVIFVVLDRKGNVVSFNRELCDKLKLDASDIRGKDWFNNFVFINDRSWLKNIFCKLMRGEMDEETEFVENGIVDKYGNKQIILWHNA